MKPDSSVLGEGLYWYAEKLMWGYEGIEINHSEALRMFRQAAELGCTDAYIRIGQLHEYGKGTKRDAAAAVVSYRTAIEAGNFYGLAFLARLISRTSLSKRAYVLWEKFIAALEATPNPGFLSATPGELLHKYIETQLRLGCDPQHLATLQRHRIAIIGYHQQVLEHATGDEQLNSLESVSDWMIEHLRH